MGRYEVVDHTADLMVRASGSTLEECFANAAYALFDQTVDLSGVRPDEEVEVRVSGSDDEERLFSLLSEMLYLEDADGFVFSEFEVRFEGGDVVCVARGERLDLSRHRPRSEVKAVTYHMMEVDRSAPSVTVLFDVRRAYYYVGPRWPSMLRLGWFSTGRGPGSRNLLQAIMDRIGSGELDAEVAFVFCNWTNEEEDNPKREQRAMFFDMVEGYGIPLVTVSWKTFMPELRASDERAWRDEYGKALREAVSPYPFDLGVLAGYMLWMDDETCREFDMLNLHPALPGGPKGTWQEVIWQLISERAERQGAMMHLCTEDWDRGAAVTYCGFPIRGGGYDALWEAMEGKLRTRTLDEIRAEEGESEPLFRKIREDGARRELPLIAETVAAFADGRVRIEGRKLKTRDGEVDGPYDLSGYVDGELGSRWRETTTPPRSWASTRTGYSRPAAPAS